MNNKVWKDWAITTFKEAAWAPLSIVGFYGIGLILHLFKSYPWVDIPTHFLGGVAITYFYRCATRNSQNVIGEIPVQVQALLAFTATGTTAIFWEFYENLMDYLLRLNMVRGLRDTILDLFMGLCGALVLSLFYRRRN